MNIITETETIIIDFLLEKPVEEVRELETFNDIFEVIDEESEEELKNHIWELIKYNLNIQDILDRMKKELPPLSDEEVETED